MDFKKIGLVLMLLSVMVSAQLNEAQTTICNILADVYNLLLYIATGVAAVMIVLMGILWIASANNPKARAGATSGVINAIIGLVIVSLAIALVSMVIQTDCIAGW